MSAIRRVLIANRGEIAVRIVRTCQQLGIETVLAVSDVDRTTSAARLADRVVCIGPGQASASYLHEDALLATAVGTGVDAIHPGYGFLSESPSFAQRCEDNGIGFIGPRAETIRTMGNKLAARAVAERHGVPVVPGTTQIQTPDDAVGHVRSIGLPVMLKAAAGGGGRGMRIVRELADLPSAFASAAAEAHAAFGDGTLYIERYIATGRHVEIQVVGDRHGAALHLFERECSLQRRQQKVIEEAPAALVPLTVREAMREVAVRLVRGIDYENLGTIEFLYDQDSGEFHFLEMNTRIQVEHPVTEQITGLDLVALQFRVAAGEPLGLSQAEVSTHGHSIECRVTAEAAREGFRPAPGRITGWSPPEGDGVRVDTHCYTGYTVPPYYDPLLAKLVVWGEDRTDALRRTRRALEEFTVEGIETNLSLLSFVLREPDVIDGAITTSWLEAALPRYVAEISQA